MVSTAENVMYIPATRVIGVREKPEEKPKLRVAAYCRVSTDREEQESSFEAQVEHYTKVINENHDWIFSGIYADEGISAMNTKKRDQFNKMISDCLDGKIDMIITKSVSRFARNTMDCLSNVRKLKAQNVAIFFEKENINTLDSKGEVMLTIMASLAQQESESIGKNVTLGLQYRYQQGKVMVNYNRFLGYTKNSEGKLVIEPSEAQVVQRIYAEYLAGKSWKKIIDGLQKDGLKNGAGNTKWWDTNIRQILTNEKYMGDALLQKTYTVDPLEKKRVKNRGDRPQYYVEGCLEPIIPKDIFMKVQEEIARRSSLAVEENRNLHRSSHALSGVVVCGNCGAPLRRLTWYNHGKKYNVWRCSAHVKDHKNCSARAIREEELQNIVLKAVNELFSGREDFVVDLQKNVQQMLIDTTSDKAKEIDSKLKDLQKQLLKDNKNEVLIGEKILKLKKQKEELYTEEASKKENIEAVDSLMLFLESGQIESYTEDLVRRYVQTIRVFGDKVIVLFKASLEVEIAVESKTFQPAAITVIS